MGMEGALSEGMRLCPLPLKGLTKDDGSVETGSGGGTKEQGRCILRGSTAPVHSQPSLSPGCADSYSDQLPVRQ